MSYLSRRFRTALVAATLVGAASAVAIASPAAALTGRTVVSATTANNLDSYKSMGVQCPTGMSGLGGGAFIVGGNGVVHLTANVPMATGQGHFAVAQAHPGFRDGEYIEATPWRLTVYAVCANGVTGRDVVLQAGDILAGSSAGSRIVTCPSGKQVVGMGGYVRGHQFMLTSLDVNSTLTTVTMTWGRAADVVGSITSWSEVWAVCVDPIPGAQRVRTVSASHSGGKSVIAACPSGTALYDLGGGLASGSHRYVRLELLVPGDVSGIVYTGEMVYGYSSNWTAFATAICGP